MYRPKSARWHGNLAVLRQPRNRRSKRQRRDTRLPTRILRTRDQAYRVDATLATFSGMTQTSWPMVTSTQLRQLFSVSTPRSPRPHTTSFHPIHRPYRLDNAHTHSTTQRGWRLPFSLESVHNLERVRCARRRGEVDEMSHRRTGHVRQNSSPNRSSLRFLQRAPLRFETGPHKRPKANPRIFGERTCPPHT